MADPAPKMAKWEWLVVWFIGMLLIGCVFGLVTGALSCARDCTVAIMADAVEEAQRRNPPPPCECDCPDTKYLVKKEKVACDHGRALQGVCDKWKEALERNEIEVDDAFYARCKQEEAP
jgi:hypothetical protein